MDKEIILNTEKIALWGPTSSGKTSLFHALIKQLSYFNLRDQDFFYEAVNPDTNFSFSVKEAETTPKPTEWKISDEIILIKRIPKKGGNFDSVTKQYYNFTHRIHLQDYKGGYAEETAEDNENNTVLNTKNLLIAIDSTNPQPYGDLLDKLYRRLVIENINLSKIRIAFCITKCDKLEIKISRPECKFEVSADYFLQNNPDKRLWDDIQVVINKFKTKFGLNVETFLTSAVGIFPQSSGSKDQKANFNGIWIESSEKWLPIGVAEPFFWVFNKVEEEYTTDISKNTKRSYSPFPRKEPVFEKFPIGWRNPLIKTN